MTNCVFTFPKLSNPSAAAAYSFHEVWVGSVYDKIWPQHTHSMSRDLIHSDAALVTGHTPGKDGAHHVVKLSLKLSLSVTSIM